MGIPATAYSSTGPTGITKRRSSPRRGSLKVRRLRSRDRFFWYTSDGVSRLVNSSNSIPEQVNDYTFAASKFCLEPYPKTFPTGGVWPPRQVDDLVCAIGSENNIDCVGDTCYNGNICEDLSCTHTLSNWKNATADWETYFELRMTEHRGIGVYTRRAFRQGAILGWYAGELKTIASMEGSKGDYLMEMEIGEIGPSTPLESAPVPSVYIDGEHKGNWTRFINHSCAADCVFRIMRVGNTRIMAVEAIRDIARGKELSVDYGKEYYGVMTRKICACGVPECVSRKRARLEKAMNKNRAEEKEKRIGNVKKRRRVAPPVMV
jgi:hypothetical protein